MNRLRLALTRLRNPTQLMATVAQRTNACTSDARAVGLKWVSWASAVATQAIRVRASRRCRRAEEGGIARPPRTAHPPPPLLLLRLRSPSRAAPSPSPSAWRTSTITSTSSSTSTSRLKCQRRRRLRAAAVERVAPRLQATQCSTANAPTQSTAVCFATCTRTCILNFVTVSWTLDRSTLFLSP